MAGDVNILMVEDNPGHAILIKKSLRVSGFENDIQHFKDGQEILEFLFSHHTASDLSLSSYIILLDICMPKTNGIQALKLIKSDEMLRSIPVIMLTTTDDEKDIALCYKYGCNGYIVKSPGLPNILEELDAILQVGRVAEINLN